MKKKRTLPGRNFLRLSALLAVCVVIATCAPAAVSPDYSSITGELSQLVQTTVDEAGITGLSVALVDDQKIVWSEGFGYADKEKGIKATPETIYGVGSISKLFTATAIMQLAEEGEIDIDQPLQIQDAILKVDGNEMIRNSLTTKGLERASEFSWKRCARETLQVYEEAVG